MTNEEKFKITEEEKRIKIPRITFTYNEDKLRYDKLNKTDKKILRSFLVKSILSNRGSKFYLKKGNNIQQRVIVEEILKQLYSNGNQLKSKLVQEVKKNVLSRSREIGKNYNNKINEIMKSKDKWILVSKKFGNENKKYFSANITSIDKWLSRLTSRFLTIREVRKFENNKPKQYTVIKLTNFGFFVGKILSREDYEIKED